jgi:hypothetical protein
VIPWYHAFVVTQLFHSDSETQRTTVFIFLFSI